MAIRFLNPYAQWINANSIVQAGAKLEFFKTESSTPKDTFSDSNLTTPNANPVVADADGRFPNIFLETGLYKVVLKTSADVTLWTADPVGDSLENLTVTGTFAINGPLTPAQITANENNYNPSGLASAATLRLSSDASWTITGLVGGAPGRIIVIRNVGSFDITLTDESGSSTAANRFALFNDIILQPDQVTILQYDGVSSRWFAIAGPENLLAGSIAFTGDITPSEITADQNDYNPTGLSAASTLRLSSDASRNVTGLAGGADGRLLLVHNVGTSNIVFVDESASSTAANRFALAGNVTLKPDQSCTLQYDSTSSRWRALSASSVPPMAKYSHIQNQGVAGGGTTAATWTICPLNTEEDPDGIMTVLSGAFTLEAGTYEIEGAHCFIAANTNRARLRVRNTTDSSNVVIGPMDGSSDAGQDVCVPIIPLTRFTIAAQKTFEMQYYITVALASIGLGEAANAAGIDETYGYVTVRKVA